MWSQGGVDGSSGRVGVQGGARGLAHQGGAGDLEAQGRSKQLGRVRAEGMKGDSGDRVEELEGADRGGGSGRLGGTIAIKGKLEMTEDGDLNRQTE